LTEDTTRQLTKVQHQKPTDGHVVALVPNELWLMDIFDMSRYMYSNKYYRYILCAIDVFTRKVYAEAMLLKDTETVTKTFQHMLNNSHVKPDSILADQDGAFLKDEFLNLLDKDKIALNLNAHKDHKVLGIIDNFAKRLKYIFTQTFLRTKSTSWINKLYNIIRVYNNQEHSALNGVAPNDAVKHREDILNINLDKSNSNHVVTDIEVGDKVRKSLLKLYSHGIVKGTDPRYTDEVFTVASVRGNTIGLSDGSTWKRNDLLRVPNDTVSSEPNVIHKEKKIYKEYKNR
jgi:hypothetical protein